MTHSTEEISDCIRSEVAKCKGILPDNIDVASPLLEDVGLHGDDFMAVAAYIHRKYKVHPPRDAYKAGITIEEWARIISECE